jgi:hypothetical protein
MAPSETSGAAGSTKPCLVWAGLPREFDRRDDGALTNESLKKFDYPPHRLVVVRRAVHRHSIQTDIDSSDATSGVSLDVIAPLFALRCSPSFATVLRPVCSVSAP